MQDPTVAKKDILASIFTQAKAEGRAAFVGYLPTGFPTVDGSRELMVALAEHADLIEVGIPFTDPMMDGPVIQEAASVALDNGVRVRDSIEMVRAITEAGGHAVVMSYWNPILQYGPERYAAEFAAAGGLGFIIPDLLPEEAEEWTQICAQHGLAPVYLVAPSTNAERMELTVNAGAGFIYAASHMGVTGAKEEISSSAQALVARVREATTLPVGVGLGVSNGEQAAEIAQFADGVIVGSALIRAVLEAKKTDGTVPTFDLVAGKAAMVALAEDIAKGVRS